MTSVAGVEGIGAADVDAEVSALFRLHFWSMVRLARQLVDDQQTAEDVVQEAFLALHRRWTRLREPERALVYLRSSVLNLARSQIRRRQVRRRMNLQIGDDTTAGADAAALSGAEADRIGAILRRLPRRQQEVLVLRYWSELDEQQIAQTLGISRGSVKTHAHRGLRTMQRLLDEVGDE